MPDPVSVASLHSSHSIPAAGAATENAGLVWGQGGAQGWGLGPAAPLNETHPLPSLASRPSEGLSSQLREVSLATAL